MKQRLLAACVPSENITRIACRQGTPNTAVTPKRDKKQRRGSSVIETLQNYDDHLSAISKFDDKIARFEELLNKMKSDLYGSMETVIEKINKTAAIVDPPPPKRGVTKIISDIQLVPPRPTSSHKPIPELSREPQEDLEPFSDFEAWTEIMNKKSKRR